MFEKVSLKFFGNLTEPYLDYFESLKGNIKKARIDMSLHQYLCLILFYSLIVFMLSMVFFSVLTALSIIDFFYAYTLGIIMSFIVTGMTFFTGYYYPNLKSKGMQEKIDRSLPFAVSYMATSASSGINPVEIFRMLSVRGGVIGEEANRIYTNVKSLGMNITDALQKAAAKSPSNSFADLLFGMSSVITAGGNLEEYLRGKSRSSMNQYRRALNNYAKQITLYTEIYITLIIVGSLFFIVLIAIISPIIGVSLVLIQTFIAFLFIPLVSAGFLVLLKAISPTEK